MSVMMEDQTPLNGLPCDADSLSALLLSLQQYVKPVESIDPKPLTDGWGQPVQYEGPEQYDQDPNPVTKFGPLSSESYYNMYYRMPRHDPHHSLANQFLKTNFASNEIVSNEYISNYPKSPPPPPPPFSSYFKTVPEKRHHSSPYDRHDDSLMDSKYRNSETKTPNEHYNDNNYNSEKLNFNSNNRAIDTVHITNIPFTATEESLRQHLSSVGIVKHVSIKTKTNNSDQKVCFAFVSFQDAETAESCIRNLSGQELDGRKLKINRAKYSLSTSKSREERRHDDDSRYQNRGFSRDGSKSRDRLPRISGENRTSSSSNYYQEDGQRMTTQNLNDGNNASRIMNECHEENRQVNTVNQKFLIGQPNLNSIDEEYIP